MIGRFFTDTEKKYMKLFKKQRILHFHGGVDRQEAYNALLLEAIKKGSHVTDDEIIALVGENIYNANIGWIKEEVES